MAAAAAPTLVPLRINVTSDTICPFCYLGLRKLQKALSLSPHIASPSAVFSQPSIRFLPFELDPTLPTNHAVSKRERYIAKFGSPQRVAAMEEMMRANGEQVGIKFDYGGDVRNTLLSHRLMERAYSGPSSSGSSGAVDEGKQGNWEQQLALLDKLFPHYFEHRGDPGDAEALARIAVEAGVFPSQEEAMRFLVDSKDYDDEVRRGIVDARRKGITGVPHFEIVAGDGVDEKTPAIKAEIPGAQDPETMVAVFRQLAEAYERAASKGSNGSAAVPGVAAGSKC